MRDNFPKVLFVTVLMVSVLWSGKIVGQKNAEPVSNPVGNQAAGGQVSAPKNPVADFSFGQTDLENAASLEGYLSTVQPLMADSPAIDKAAALQKSTTTSLFSRIGWNNPPNVQAKIVLISDLKTGADYFGYGDYRRWPTASLTKLAVAAAILKKGDLNSAVALSQNDFINIQEDSVPYLQPGNRYSAGDLLKPLLLASRNEAADAFADFYGYNDFIGELNALASSLGMASTYFQDPSGLSASNQSTAEDLKKLAGYIYDNYPEIFKITSQKQDTITELSSGKKYVVGNINDFAGQADFLGGKTGYTDEADGNLLSVFSYENKPVLFIVLGSGDRFGDTQKLVSWFENNFK